MIVPATQEWSDSRALEISMKDFRAAESIRLQNNDRRFRESMRLFYAYVQPKTWEGTKIPRASVPIFLALREIMAMIPQIMRALFSDDPFFDAEPLPNSTMAQARATVSLLRHQLRSIGLTSDLTLREIVRRTLMQSLIFGNGIIQWGWIVEEIKRQVWARVPIPERQLVIDGNGDQVAMPTGKINFQSISRQVVDTVSRPIVQCIDIRDYYIDPNCTSHNTQDAGFDSVRYYKTISELKAMAIPELGFKLPTDKQLLELSKAKTASQGDQSKTIQESYRGNTYQPSRDSSADMSLARIEMICYQQKYRDVWVLGRQHVFYNRANEYGKITRQNAFYIDVPGQFYGLSICDLVEGDQKLAETIINARIDELSILVHPPIIKKQGVAMPASAQRLRPFAVWESPDPKNDYTRFEMGNVTANAYIEVDALELRTQKVTGNNDIVMGVASGGGNSANRTAAGVSAQVEGTGVRKEYQVENIEDQFIVPLLGNLHFMNQRFLSPDDAIKVLGPQAQDLVLDPLDVMNASVRFTMKASSKMRSRAALQQGLPVFLNSVLNPTIMELAAKQGITPNFQVISQLLCDTLNIPQTELFRMMSPEERQQMFQPSPDQSLRAQMQQEREAGTSERQSATDDTKLLIEFIKKVMTPDAAHKLLGLKPPAQIEAEYAPKPAGGK